jgi:hypothetical protein
MPQQKKLLIGLTGPAGSGKDATADAICNIVGTGTAVRLAFADALRSQVCEAFDVPMSYLTTRDTKEHPISALALAHCRDVGFVSRMLQLHGDASIGLSVPRSPRWVMQQWGTEYRRAADPGYWVNRLTKLVGSAWYIKRVDTVVVSDVRFSDEADVIRRLGGEIWQVQRPGFGVTVGGHASEVLGAEFEPVVVINNNWTLHDLSKQVLNVLVSRLVVQTVAAMTEGSAA